MRGWFEIPRYPRFPMQWDGEGKARKRIRTADPFLTMEVLYQLSYPGVFGFRKPLPLNYFEG